jgi:hypothetical protein
VLVGRHSDWRHQGRGTRRSDLLDCSLSAREVVIGGSYEDDAGNLPPPKIVRDRSFRERRRPGCLKGSGVIGDLPRSTFIGNADVQNASSASTTPSAPLARAAASPRLSGTADAAPGTHDVVGQSQS